MIKNITNKLTNWLDTLGIGETSFSNFQLIIQFIFQHGGLNVDCQVTESATVVAFNEYSDGMATVLLVNHTEKAMIHFHQRFVLIW